MVKKYDPPLWRLCQHKGYLYLIASIPMRYRPAVSGEESGSRPLLGKSHNKSYYKIVFLPYGTDNHQTIGDILKHITF